MRNWNEHVVCFETALLPRCEPTYEELKLVWIPTYRSFPVQLRAYLWGIETMNISFNIYIPNYVASLPMRNWNKFLLSLHSQHQERCEPTYEELKPCFYLHSSLTPFSCEPTYEELKPLVFLHLKMLWVGCEPTYEELKHWDTSHSALLSVVASLPMRNWNDEKPIRIPFYFAVASLPMRNWNAGFLQVLQWQCSVASLPMRNWNPMNHNSYGPQV